MSLDRAHDKCQKEWEENNEHAWLAFVDIAKLAIGSAQKISPCIGPDEDLCSLMLHIENVLFKYDSKDE